MSVKDLLHNVDKIYYSNTFPKSGEMLLRLSDYGRIHLEKIAKAVGDNIDTVYDEYGNLILLKGVR